MDCWGRDLKNCMNSTPGLHHDKEIQRVCVSDLVWWSKILSKTTHGTVLFASARGGARGVNVWFWWTERLGCTLELVRRKLVTQTLMDPHMERSDPHMEGSRGLKSLDFEGPRAVWSVWAYNKHYSRR